MKLLIGDEDTASNELILKGLENSGHELVVALTEDEVWKQLSMSESRASFAILNYGAGKLNGLEICKRFRALPSLRYTYFVLMNGTATQQEILEILKSGADDYLCKPVNIDALAVRVEIGRKVLQNEEKLTSITQEWKVMLDNLPFGIACLGPEGELKRANRPFFDLVGYKDMKTLLNKRIGETVIRFPADSQELMTNIRALQPFDRIEVDFVKRDNSVLKLCMWGRPIKFAGAVFEVITSRV